MPLATAWVAPARPSRWMRNGWSLSVSSSGDSVPPRRVNGLPCQCPLPCTSSGGAASACFGWPLRTSTRISVRPSASRNCRRPSSMRNRLSCGLVPPALPPRKSQLPGSPLRDAVSSSTSGRVRRTSGSCTLPRSSGHTRTSISTRSAVAISGCFAQLALAKVIASARIVLVRPRSTSRFPMCSARPVRACTARSTGPLNQFQSHSAISSRSAASRKIRIVSQRRPRGSGRRRRQRVVRFAAGEAAAFTPPWLPPLRGQGAKRPCAWCAHAAFERWFTAPAW